MNLPAADRVAWAALLAMLAAATTLHAQEPERRALCRAFDGKGGDVTLVNLVPYKSARTTVDVTDADVDGDGQPDPMRLACGGSAPCTLDIALVGAKPLVLTRERIALLRTGSQVYVSSTQTQCRHGKFVQTTELDAVAKGRLVARCGPTTVPLQVAGRGADC